MYHTKSDISLSLFLHWTHVNAGRRLGAKRHEGRIELSETGALLDTHALTRRRPARPFGWPRRRLPNGVWVFPE